MALNNAAADAALEVWIASVNPPSTNPQAVRDGFRDMFRAIYSGIVTNAVVTPNGTPTSLRTTTGVLLLNTSTGTIT